MYFLKHRGTEETENFLFAWVELFFLCSLCLCVSEKCMNMTIRFSVSFLVVMVFFLWRVRGFL